MIITQNKLLTLLSGNLLLRRLGWKFKLTNFKSLTITSATPEGLAKIFNCLRKLDLASEITILRLSNNGLSCLPEGLFEGLVSLSDLYLSHNEITILSENQFQGLENLRYLNLSHNQISTLAENQFQGLGALEHLNLCNNQISTLAENSFQGLGTLEGLDLSDNQIIGPVRKIGLNNLKGFYGDNNFLLFPNRETAMLSKIPDPGMDAIFNHHGFNLDILNHAIENNQPWGVDFSEEQIEELVEKRDIALKQKVMLFQCLRDRHDVPEVIGDLILEYTGHHFPKPIAA